MSSVNSITTIPPVTYKNYAKLCNHAGKYYPIGDRQIMLGARIDLTDAAIHDVDILIPLCDDLPYQLRFGKRYDIWNMPLVDHGGVPEDWLKHVKAVWKAIDKGKKVLGYCIGGHGRTGTLYASLVAHVEKPEDPIDLCRSRYCQSIIESNAQAKAVFGILGKRVPSKHITALSQSWGWSGMGSTQPYTPVTQKVYLVEFADGSFERVWDNNGSYFDYNDPTTHTWVKFMSIKGDGFMGMSEFISTYSPWGPFLPFELTVTVIQWLNEQVKIHKRVLTDDEIMDVITYGIPSKLATVTSIGKEK